AQLGSAPASGAGGRWFKSSRPDHFPFAPSLVSMTFVRSAAEIVVEGRVQGVGYRNFAHRKAAQLGLHGYVMNLKDGRVRVRVEGSRELSQARPAHAEGLD